MPSISGLPDWLRPETTRLTLLALVLIGATGLFLGILVGVVTGGWLVGADKAIHGVLQAWRTPAGNALLVALTELGDMVVVVAVTIAVFWWLAGKRAWRASAYWLVAIIGISVLNTAIKAGIHRARPSELFYTGWSIFSFPSGHTTVNCVVYGFLAVLAGRGLSPAKRVPVVVAVAALVLLIAFSRLYLGAHWFSDVVGGLALGTAWLAACSLLYLRKPAEPVGAKALLAVACTALIAAGGLHVYQNHAIDMQRYSAAGVIRGAPAFNLWALPSQQLFTQMSAA